MDDFVVIFSINYFAIQWVPRSLRFLQGAGAWINHTAGFLTLIRMMSQSFNRTRSWRVATL
jgi:hypothetical protein